MWLECLWSLPHAPSLTHTYTHCKYQCDPATLSLLTVMTLSSLSLCVHQYHSTRLPVYQCVCVFPLKVTSSCSARDKLNQILSCSSTYFWTSVIWSKCTDWLEVVHSYRGRAFWYWKLLKVSLCYPIGTRCMWWSGRELGLPKCNLKTPACHLKTILIFISCISKL